MTLDTLGGDVVRFESENVSSSLNFRERFPPYIIRQEKIDLLF